MQQRVLPIVLALCLCMSIVPGAYVRGPAPQKDLPAEEYTAGPIPYEDAKIPTQREVYDALIAQKASYPEEMEWTDSNSYTWKGGTAGGIAASGSGCVAFAYILSDAAFGSLPARMYANGGFSFSDVKAGDILRVNGDSHTVIVLQVSDAGIEVAEGNYHENGSGGFIHWGRSITKAEVEAASHYITRYPEGYVDPDDPGANDPVDGGTGTLDGGLTWTLTKAGTLTISGTGSMPDFNPASEQPWYGFKDQIQKIIIENGVSYIGFCAFQGSKALSVSIPDSVTMIGNHAFRESSIISVTIPASVKTISDDAFRSCLNLSAATVSDGVETIGERVFQGCQKLDSITLPASVTSVGAGTFTDCVELKSAVFAPGSKTVTLGDNLFTRCWRLAKVTLPKNMDCIGVEMFQNCFDALASLDIPQGVTSIKSSAFASCSALTSITIPDSVTTIETAAFSACNALRDIYFSGSEAQWNSIDKTADVIDALKDVTVHYNSSGTGTSPEPDPGPNPAPDPGHEHSWAAAWSNDSSYHWHECSAANCDITSNSGKKGYGAHSYGDWVIDQSAASYQNGSRHRTCTACGYSQTEGIPATGGPSAGENSGSSSYTPPSTTATVQNPDGSATTTKTDNRTGTVTETTRYPDGSQTVVETQKDGTVTTRETDRTGNKTETVSRPDGSSTILVERKDGTAATVASDASGKVEAEVRLSVQAVSAARQNGVPVTLPIPEVQAARDSNAVPVITVNTGSDEPVMVEIPVADPTPGTVAVIVHADGTEEAVKTSVPTAAGVAVALPDKATVKIVDNSTVFADVSPRHWAADAVSFVSARGLFAGTTESAFTPEAPMTRAMLMVVLARFDGADTSSGGTWYEKGMEWAVASGISDGSAPDGNITREQLITMLWRYAGSPAAAGSLSGFADADQVNGYAQEAVCWAVENGIISGVDAQQLAPHGQATRAQVAQMLKNYIEKLL